LELELYLLGEKSQQTRAAVCGDGTMVAKRNEERKERREREREGRCWGGLGLGSGLYSVRDTSFPRPSGTGTGSRQKVLAALPRHPSGKM
jgi:hypothetical protein